MTHPLLEPEVRELDNYLAVGLAEGFEEGTDQEVLSAWQYLVDTGLVWKLQGKFSRTASALIEQGVLTPGLV